MRILAVEDDGASRLLLERMLQNWGHQVTVCENGRDAFDLFVSEKFDVVVSDWMMPVSDGLDLCRKIRDLKRQEYCYFILITARSRQENLAEGMEAGADDYLTKPLESVELKLRLKVAERIIGLTSDVRLLRGLLPMCAWCKAIREDENLWESIEQYIEGHSSAELTHAICPRCLEKQMAELPPSP
ncbi:MAG TPA: response regulator [Blastocatellia bacterium]|nr:response regulator [Blastocatellia bacterium]